MFGQETKKRLILNHSWTREFTGRIAARTEEIGCKKGWISTGKEICPMGIHCQYLMWKANKSSWLHTLYSTVLQLKCHTRPLEEPVIEETTAYITAKWQQGEKWSGTIKNVEDRSSSLSDSWPDIQIDCTVCCIGLQWRESHVDWYSSKKSSDYGTDLQPILGCINLEGMW